MGGRWTWERGDAVWMDAEQGGGRKMEERQQSRGRRRSIIRNLTPTNIHSVGVQKNKTVIVVENDKMSGFFMKTSDEQLQLSVTQACV